MHSDIARGVAMLQSVTQFRADLPLNPENERAEELFAEVSSAVDDLRSMGGTQEFNRRKVSGTSSERQQLADRMRKIMRQIARVAKVLDRAQYPDARFKLRVPRSNGYQPLLIRANVYLQTVATMKDEFTKRGMPADFDARLQALLDQFESATRRKNSSLSGQISSTAGMKERLRQAVRAVRELDVILSLLYDDNPPLYSVWRSASHIQRAPRRAEKLAAAGGEVTSSSGPEAAGVGATVETPVPGEAALVDGPPPVPLRDSSAPLTDGQSAPVDPNLGRAEPHAQLAFW